MSLRGAKSLVLVVGGEVLARKKLARKMAETQVELGEMNFQTLAKKLSQMGLNPVEIAAMVGIIRDMARTMKITVEPGRLTLSASAEDTTLDLFSAFADQVLGPLGRRNARLAHQGTHHYRCAKRRDRMHKRQQPGD